MLFSPRISTGALSQLCRRLATSLEAGVDVRTVCAREAEHATGLAARPRFRAISEAVNRGDSLSEALEDSGDYFPGLFREMTLVGERTGHLGEIFGRLADHYDEQIRRRRIFLVAISWPMVELSIAVVVIGLFIWILGIIGDSGKIPDPLGFGLGNEGLFNYVMFLAAIGAVIFFVVYALRRGVVWTQPIQRAVLRIPVLGKAVETMCLARMAWSLHLTMSTDMDVRQSLRLSLRSARNARYTAHMRSVDDSIVSGSSIHEAFLETGDYPSEFLDNLEVGEESGNLAESMATLSRQYQDRADAAMKVITMLAGLGVMLMVFAIIIFLIFSIFINMYMPPINETLDMMGMA